MSIDWASWANLVLRWFHVIAGIAWIGSSFYFVWLDNHLRRRPGMDEGLAGELWAVHGGGFYQSRKYLVAPAELPDELHWFKYEAYFTWLSGFFLLVLLYYYGAELYLIDPAKLALGKGTAIAIGLGVLAGGWIFYDLLCRSPLGRHDGALGIVWFLALVALAYGLEQIFSGRGAFIHVGAVIGTAMAANVFFVIIPNQKKAVAAMIAGERPDPELGRKAKQRSLHNNYMTLPVIFIMVSNHYPMTFTHQYGWAILAGLSLAGVLVRHFFNRRHKGETRVSLLVAATVVFALTVLLAAETGRSGGAPTAGKVGFAEVRAIIDRHCIMCHSATPTHPGFDAPPAGVAFDSAGEIRRYAPRIRMQAVDADIMPLGNETGMTAAERARLGAWIAQEGKGDGER